MTDNGRWLRAVILLLGACAGFVIVSLYEANVGNHVGDTDYGLGGLVSIALWALVGAYPVPWFTERRSAIRFAVLAGAITGVVGAGLAALLVPHEISRDPFTGVQDAPPDCYFHALGENCRVIGSLWMPLAWAAFGSGVTAFFALATTTRALIAGALTSVIAAALVSHFVVSIVSSRVAYR